MYSVYDVMKIGGHGIGFAYTWVKKDLLDVPKRAIFPLLIRLED